MAGWLVCRYVRKDCLGSVALSKGVVCMYGHMYEYQVVTQFLRIYLPSIVFMDGQLIGHPFLPSLGHRYGYSG